MPTRELGALEERIAAHVQGLLTIGPPALAAHVAPALTGDDIDAAFAAAYALLRLGDAALAGRVVEAMAVAPIAARAGIAEALCHAAPPAALPRLQALAASSDDAVHAAALEVLAFRGALRSDLAAAALERLLGHEEAPLRLAAWRTATWLGAPVAARHYAAALRAATPGFAALALESAAWARLPEVLVVGRRAAAEPSPAGMDALALLAALGGPDDARLVMRAAAEPSLGPERYALLAATGSPAAVGPVLDAMADPDPATAAAAGAAFARLTGHEVATLRTVSTAPADADPVDAAFADEVGIPDAEEARRVWVRLTGAVGGAVRLNRGVDVGRPLDASGMSRIDLLARRELFLRARLHGSWDGLPAQLEVFPQLRSGAG